MGLHITPELLITRSGAFSSAGHVSGKSLIHLLLPPLPSPSSFFPSQRLSPSAPHLVDVLSFSLASYPLPSSLLFLRPFLISYPIVNYCLARSYSNRLPIKSLVHIQFNRHVECTTPSHPPGDTHLIRTSQSTSSRSLSSYGVNQFLWRD
jgi:hypothetical protein